MNTIVPRDPRMSVIVFSLVGPIAKAEIQACGLRFVPETQTLGRRLRAAFQKQS